MRDKLEIVAKLGNFICNIVELEQGSTVNLEVLLMAIAIHKRKIEKDADSLLGDIACNSDLLSIRLFGPNNNIYDVVWHFGKPFAEMEDESIINLMTFFGMYSEMLEWINKH